MSDEMEEPRVWDDRSNEPPYEGEGVAQQLDVFDDTPISGLDDGLALWVVGRIAAKHDEIARIQTQAAAMVKDVETDLKGLEWKYGSALQDWTREKLASGRKGARSHKTLNGTCAFRTVPGRVVVTDQDLALTTCPEAAKTVIDTKKVPVIDTLDELTGEILKAVPAGCIYVPARESFSVKGLKKQEEGTNE